MTVGTAGVTVSVLVVVAEANSPVARIRESIVYGEPIRSGRPYR